MNLAGKYCLGDRKWEGNPVFNHRSSSDRKNMNKESRVLNKNKKHIKELLRVFVASNRTPVLAVPVILALVLTVALTSAFTLTGCSSKKNSQIDTTDGITNILDYVTVDFSGKNGEGTAYVNVDYDGIETEMVGGEEKIKEMDEVEDLSALTKYINAVSSISFNIDKNAGLSNGDQVIVSVSYDDTAAQAAGVNFGDQSSKTYEVKGLKK